MLRFFRHIRQRLFLEGKMSRYFGYAMGEIVLIVVGILIALQVSDWNEARKLKQVEIHKLIEISTALDESAANLKTVIEEEQRWLGYSETLLDHMENRKPYHEGLDICFGTYYWPSVVQLSRSSFDQLKSTGLEIISNESIRKNITYIFDTRFELIKSENEEWDAQLLVSAIMPTHIQLFQKYFPEGFHPTGDEYAKPLDYEELLENEVFKNILGEIMSVRKYNIEYNQQIHGEVNLLIHDINLEVEALSN